MLTDHPQDMPLPRYARNDKIETEIETARRERERDVSMWLTAIFRLKIILLINNSIN